MAKNISFDSDGVPKQQPSVNQKRVDYSMPITGDNDFIDETRDADPLKTYSIKILRGRAITFILASLNLAVIALWMFFGLRQGAGAVWWYWVYGLGMITCCAFMFTGKEAARKFFAYPACLIGVPLVFALLINPASLPNFIKTSYQLALQILSAALLYFLPSVSAFFSASPKARRRALDHEWEKQPPAGR